MTQILRIDRIIFRDDIFQKDVIPKRISAFHFFVPVF